MTMASFLAYAASVSLALIAFLALGVDISKGKNGNACIVVPVFVLIMACAVGFAVVGAGQ